MIDKKLYIQLKRDIRCLCRPNLIKLCDEVELNDFERSLLIELYENKTSVDVCMRYGINKNSYTMYMKKILTKIYNYKNTH